MTESNRRAAGQLSGVPLNQIRDFGSIVKRHDPVTLFLPKLIPKSVLKKKETAPDAVF